MLRAQGRLGISNTAPSDRVALLGTPCSAVQRPRSRRVPIVQANKGVVSYSASQLAGTTWPRSYAYKALSVAFGGLGAAFLGAPNPVIELAYAATPTLLMGGMVRALGAVHLLAAIVTSALSDAAHHDRLNSDTYKRLNLGISLWGVASLAAFFNSPVAATFNAQIVYGSVLGAAAFVAPVLSKGLFAPLPPLPSLLPLISARRIYNLGGSAAAVFAGTVLWSAVSLRVPSVSYLAAPLGVLGTLAVQLLAAGAVLLTFVLMSLEDAARRGRLGASTFKSLNWGVALVGGVIAALAEKGVRVGLLKAWPPLPTTANELLARWTDVFSEYAFGLTVIVALFSLFKAVTAKK